MSLNDRSFIEQAYAALLNRAADQPGLDANLRALKAGRSRILILGGLRYSPEGKQAGAVVPGLYPRTLLHRLYTIRGAGPVLRTLVSLIALPTLAQAITRLRRAHQAVHAEDTAASASTARDTDMRATRNDDAFRAVHRRVDQLATSLNQLEARIAETPWANPALSLAQSPEYLAGPISQNEQLITAVAANTLSLNEAVWAEQLEALLGPQRSLAARAISAAEDALAQVRDQERRLSLLLTDIQKLTAEGVLVAASAAAPDRTVGQHNLMLDALYLSFEDRFRGSRAEIKQRQTIYLDDLRSVGAGAPDRPIVDVGSGRGELLELLSEAGLQARGVDLNEAMVAKCTRAGLDAVQGDAVTYLAGLEPGSLGAVTGFHIIEHLPFPVMIELLDASLRALAPGGMIIFEMPNPANLQVASRWFSLGPAHRNLLPAEMVTMLADARGFTEVCIRELHPMQLRFEAKDDVLASQLDAIFHGPQDFALIARKP